MTSKLLRVIGKANVPKMLATAALGPKHPVKYRMLAGGFIMAAGVYIAKAPSLYDMHAFALHFVLDVIGYGVHAVGVTPILEALIGMAAEDAVVAEAAVAVAASV